MKYAQVFTFLTILLLALPATDKLKKTTKDGLINQGVRSILEDKTGNLWVGTGDTGLYLYDGKTFITYSAYKH